MPERANRAVFLDRDGVLSVPEFRDGRSYAPKRMEDFVLYPDAPQSVADLKAMGFLAIVVTNQPDVGKGEVDRAVVEAMHTVLKTATKVDDIEVCYDTRETATERMKPGAGMLLDAARNWNIDLEGSYVVGDRAGDVEAGERAGCTTIFVDRGYTGETKPTSQAATVKELHEAVAWIAAKERMGP